MNNTGAFLTLSREVFIKHPKRSEAFVKQLKQKGFKLDSRTEKRIKTGTAIATVTNLWFSALRGDQTMESEHLSGLLLGAVTPVYDDLMDLFGYTHDEIVGGKFNGIPDSSSLIHLSSYLIPETYQSIAQKEAYNHFYMLTVAGQTQSHKQQSGESLTTAQLDEVMGQKGGNATLLYRQILANPMIEGEENAVFLLGKLMQFINDLFDTRSDFLAGNLTLTTSCEQPKELRHMFDSLVGEMTAAFSQLSYPKKNIKNALRLMLPVIARGEVCLKQFEQLYRQYGHFRLAEFSRQELVCDMEKSANLWANYREAERLYRRFVRI